MINYHMHAIKYLFLAAFFFMLPMSVSADAGCGALSYAGSQCMLNSVSGICSGPSGTCQTGIQTSGGGSNQTVTSGRGNSSAGVTLLNPLQGGASLSSFLSSILQFVVTIGSVVIVLMIVFVGFKFVVAQGAPDKIKEARDMLLWTIVGALVLLGAQAIALAIQATVTALGG